ncbi:MAG: hypothetical protein ABI644_14330 [Arenimonas sp.]
MGIFNTLQKKQVNNGIFIALLVVFAAGIIAWWYSQPGARTEQAVSDMHPLGNADTVPLCSLLPPVTGSKICQDADPQITVAGHSMWKDEKEEPLLRADLVTTRNLSDTEKLTTLAWFQKALPEIKASGRQDWEEPNGAWSHAVITRRDKEQEILLEDGGIILILQSKVMSRTDLLTYANQAAKALRNAKSLTSSGDGATPKWIPAAPVKP